MMVMAPGANTALGAAQCSWTLECGNPSAFGDYAAVALLPLDDKRHPKGKQHFSRFPRPGCSGVVGKRKSAAT